MRTSILIGFVCASIISCTDTATTEKLNGRIAELEIQLDECQNGEARIVAKIEQAYADAKIEDAKSLIAELRERFPESEQNLKMAQLLATILAEEARSDSIKQAEEKEKDRLANLNNTGIWKVGFYVDEFGEPTTTGYIRNLLPIRGTFSNTATQDSELDVIFLITDANDISIQLYEYARNNPVKAYSSEGYRIMIEDADGVRSTFNGWNRSDRINLDKSASGKVHGSLMKGGLLKFRITEMNRGTTQYSFNIQNATYYDNAYRLLTEK